MAISQIAALIAHISFSRAGVGRSTPLSNGNFTDCCSDSSYFIWQSRCWKIYLLCQTAISQIAALIAHISFARPGVGRSTPPSNGNFTDCCSDSSYFIWQSRFWKIYLLCQTAISQIPALTDSSYFIPTLRAHIWQTRCLQIYPPNQMAISQIAALTAQVSLGRPGVGRSIPPSNGNFTDSCSDSSYLIWQSRHWKIYTPIKLQFHRLLL